MSRHHVALLATLCAGVLLSGLLLPGPLFAQPDAHEIAVPVEETAPIAPTPPRPAADEPIEVQLSLTLNKIAEIDTVEETYVVDAYLAAEWSDAEATARLIRPGGERSLYLDQATEELLSRSVWWPDLELINTQGGRDVNDARLEVFGDGRLRYTERFQAELSSNMDFRRYPFDHQQFQVRVESYTYRDDDVVFVEPVAIIGHLKDTPLPDWSLYAPRAEISRHEYGDGTYSRYTFTIEGDRLPGYFVWQVFLPLLLIIGTSWIVFWLTSIGDKISVAFTCLLTLVAFNFYTATLLPQLPYNTFIEVVVITAYIETFLLIAFILVTERLRAAGQNAAYERLDRTGRLAFPLGLVLSMVLTSLWFF